MDFKILSCFFLLLYLLFAVIDGLYFHIYKYKLYAREESRKEHLLHTLNAIIFPWSLYFIYFDQFKGLFLYFGVFLLLVSLVIEFFDVYEESKSRKSLGGLTNNEYAMHFALSGLRGVYSTLVLVSKPNSDWLISSTQVSSKIVESPLITYFIYPVIIIGVFISIVHLLLVFSRTENSKEIRTL